MKSTSNQKIFNDPVYGFVSIPGNTAFQIIEHPYFQRLRRISQLGLTLMVYPGANHTRFQHVLGASHLMVRAIETLKFKGVEITDDEAEAAVLAILLHDIGHGPFSHTLEFNMIKGVSHEVLSQIIMEKLNKEFDGKLELTMEIFNGKYHKKFLHSLVSGQLDVDRLDYLKRDSFFTGVSEGVIGSERIIKMLNVANGELAVEAKGVYSIEKFLIARRLMYWQVYLHKTVLAAENLLNRILERARHLAKAGEKVPASAPLHYFLYSEVNRKAFYSEPELIDTFSQLDDFDILTAVKGWQMHPDKILSELSKMLINRRLPRVELRRTPVSEAECAEKTKLLMKKTGYTADEAKYFVYSDKVENRAYSPNTDKINILRKDGTVADLSEEADLLKTGALSSSVKKYFICYPKIV